MTIQSNGCYTTFRSDISKDDLLLHYNRLAQTSQKLNIDINFKLVDLQAIVDNVQEEVIIKVINNNGDFKVEYRDYHKQEGVSLKTIQKPEWWGNLKLYPNDKQVELLNRAKTSDSVDDYLLVDNELVLETVIANIFYIKNDVLYTPKLNDSILSGTTRMRVIENCNVIQKDVSLNDICSADIVFICNAARGIVIVSQIDEHIYDISNSSLQQVEKYNEILKRKAI